MPPPVPRPTRLPPFIYNHPHQVAQDHDVDWTIPDDRDRGTELSRRHARNEMIREQLQAGKPVVYRSSGWSLFPRVHSNDATYYVPVTKEEDVSVGDIVFCQVEPGLRYYAHLISKKEWYNEKWWYTITDRFLHRNGWADIEHIYGRLENCWH